MFALLLATVLSVQPGKQLQPPMVVAEASPVATSPRKTRNTTQLQRPMVSVEAPGVSVQVLRPGRYYPVPMIILPAPDATEVQPSQMVLRRRYYWTPIRDLLFGRWRIEPAPMQEPRTWDSDR